MDGKALPISASVRSEKPASLMRLYAELITIPTSDTPGTIVLLHFDDKRYFFGNISEGTQRACAERGMRLVSVSDIFLTGRTEWKNTGGLLGMMLTVAESVSVSMSSAVDEELETIKRLEKQLEAPEYPKIVEQLETRLQKHRDIAASLPEKAANSAALNLHGGPNLTRMLATARTFICRKGMPVTVQEFDDDGPTHAEQDGPLEPTWSDDHIKVWALPVYPSTTAASQHGRNGSKRDFSEFQESTASDRADQSGGDVSQTASNLAASQKVVSGMFHSAWKPDDMEEFPLAKAPTSATLFIRDPDTNEVKRYTGPKPGEDGANPELSVLARKPWPGALVGSLPPTSPSQCSVSYIVRSHDVRGKFDVKKAKELNVKKGPDYGFLSQGQSVTSTDGQTVTPDMVLGPDSPGQGIAMVELPTVEYVENLVSRPEWKSDEAMTGVAVIIWNLGRGVGDDLLLREFITGMPQYKHIFASEDHCANSLVFKGVGRMTTEFAHIDGERYHIPIHDNKFTSPALRSDDGGKRDTQAAETPLKIDMVPKFEVSVDREQKKLDDTKLSDQHSLKRINKGIAKVRESLEEPEVKKQLANMRQSLPGGDAEIITLGTGSSQPSRYRNVSSTLLRVPGQGSYLLDCGEGTLGQLKRTLGPSELKEVLRDLKMIWISHLHADHHLGMIAVIKAWYEEVFGAVPPPSKPTSQEDISLPRMLKERRLVVVSERPMLNWLSEYANVENYGYDKTVLLEPVATDANSDASADRFRCVSRDSNGEVTLRSDNKVNSTFCAFDGPLSSLLRQATGLSSLLSVRVRHCLGSRAVSLVFPSGFKFSYSGDCRPSERFARIGQGSTVLLHEATFEDELLDEAIAKRHSTVSEALAIGKSMQAKAVVLTHFSQRYRGMPVVNKAVRRGLPPVGEDNNNKGVPNAVHDIPVSDEAEDVADDATVLATNVPGTSGDGGGGNGSDNGQFDAPVVLAFDHMRLRVEDALVAEAYSPAFRKHLKRIGADMS